MPILRLAVGRAIIIRVVSIFSNMAVHKLVKIIKQLDTIRDELDDPMHDIDRPVQK